jgi:acylglycerol lipase
MLHGLISHSGWLIPIAEQLADGGVTTICPDRRGSGANSAHRGDAPSGAALLDDLDCIVDRFAPSGDGVHLAGFCWGATYAINYLTLRGRAVKSLALLAPSIVPTAAVRAEPLITGSSGVATEDPAIPPEAFTRGPAYEHVILPDPLRLQKLSPRLNGILEDFAFMIGAKLSRLTVPTLMVLAQVDRVVDNAATEQLFRGMRAKPKKLHTVSGEHGVQFDAPREVAAILHDWIARKPRSPSQ